MVFHLHDSNAIFLFLVKTKLCLWIPTIFNILVISPVGENISYTEMMLVEIVINRVMFPDFGAQLQVDCGQIQRAKADPSVVGFLPVGVSKQRGRLGQMVSPFMLFTPKDWIWGNFSWENLKGNLKSLSKLSGFGNSLVVSDSQPEPLLRTETNQMSQFTSVPSWC